MIRDRAALIAGILAAPDDDAPRLVMADWFQENGDEARAELIRVQVELDDYLPNGDGRCAECGCHPGKPHMAECRWLRLAKRSDQLLDAHAARWLAEVPVDFEEPLRPGLFRRGFLWGLTLTAEAWLRAGDEILAAAPVTEVWLTSGLDPFMVGGLMAAIGDPLPIEFASREAWFVRGDSHVRDPLPLLHRRWPRVKVWHLPFERRN